jgi:hypothetical protein
MAMTQSLSKSVPAAKSFAATKLRRNAIAVLSSSEVLNFIADPSDE